MLRLKYHGTTTIPIEADVITPDFLADKSAADIGRLSVLHGNAPAPLGDFFQVEGDASDRTIVIEGDCGPVKRIGARMAAGRITLTGAAGMYLGAEMAGGEIVVHGGAGDWLGAEMRGGRIHVHGHAGDLVGAAYRGSRKGMRGGVILVDGRAGDEIGATMRRGLIAVGSDVGECAGVNLIAGSIFAFSHVDKHAGAGMKRGSLVCFGPPPTLLPTFRLACVYQPVFVRLFLKQLQAWQFAPAQRTLDDSFARWCGDFVSLGKGEVLVRD